MIYIIEGPDGVGKTTLANAILEKSKGHLLHATYDKTWDIKDYHGSMITAAHLLNKYQDVILDRWAPSDGVYGRVFRGEPSYDTRRVVELADILYDIKWIYCRNDNAVENHLRNKEKREEMYDSMEEVVKEYDKYMRESFVNWIQYDFTKNNMNQFVEKLLGKERSQDG